MNNDNSMTEIPDNPSQEINNEQISNGHHENKVCYIYFVTYFFIQHSAFNMNFPRTVGLFVPLYMILNNLYFCIHYLSNLQDYYDSMATLREIRPISVTENIQWNLMSKMAKFLWVIGTLIQMLSLTIFSLRVDRICDKNYISNHWKHYSGEEIKLYIHF